MGYTSSDNKSLDKLLTNNQYFDIKINMNYKDKTIEKRINELAELHQRIEDLEAEATKRKQLEAEIQDAREYAENIVETVREPLVVLNSDLKILTANHSFYDTFKVTPEETIGNFIYDLGNRQWDIPKLRVLFEEILPHDTVFNGYEVEHDFLGIGRKIILLNARQIFREKIGSHIILLAMEDITERKQLEDELQNAHDKLELIVNERTRELTRANVQLTQEIEERKNAAESLREALKEVKQLKNQLREENLYLKEEFNLLNSHEDIVGNSEAIRTVLMQIEQVAGTDSTVLIQGETGTGKELVANAIHGMSSRKDRLMIKVNCAALPPTLIESELFGREKGAFTGALSKQLGRFELADASTIFLDDINTLPLELQAKLLRVVESGEFERLGSPRTVKVDVRIISATNRDLAKLVSEGGFREDLYYRLNVFQITVPPLHERREDILPLVWSFVQEFSKRMGKRIESIPQKGVEALQAYPWPGNVRELRNVTERAMILTTGHVLHLDVPKIAQSDADQSGTLEEAEKRHIIEALNTTGWRVSGKDGAAEILGLNPKTLESRMQRLGIQRKKKNS
ncbi:MAG: sigma 54-interacting transcriptional regulator [Thermodesulfovibrionales bacterium]|nr:sigma 54-interacting transcriptional regulator [Thermodesulfovibrionales bacterium]